MSQRTVSQRTASLLHEIDPNDVHQAAEYYWARATDEEKERIARDPGQYLTSADTLEWIEDLCLKDSKSRSWITSWSYEDGMFSFTLWTGLQRRCTFREIDLFLCGLNLARAYALRTTDF